jgi:hypothetical protein
VRAVQAVNTQLIETYWQVGQRIVEFEQNGKERAEYGKALISQLAQDLTLRLGKGFSRSNLVYMRLFYLRYPISQKPSHQLSWSHYVELLKLDDDLERSFYEKQAISERWSVPELKRQKVSSLFLRLVASKDKDGILQLAQQGQVIEQPADLLREPYVFEFQTYKAHSDGLTTEGQAIQASIVSVALTVAPYIGPLHSLGHKDRHNLGAHLRLSFRRVGRDSFVTPTDA